MYSDCLKLAQTITYSDDYPYFPFQNRYSFAGLNTATDGSGISYSPGDMISLVESDITLYAQWEKITPFDVQG